MVLNKVLLCVQIEMNFLELLLASYLDCDSSIVDRQYLWLLGFVAGSL